MKSIHRLQLAQKAAVRVVKKKARREHMTPILRNHMTITQPIMTENKALILYFNILYITSRRHYIETFGSCCYPFR